MFCNKSLSFVFMFFFLTTSAQPTKENFTEKYFLKVSKDILDLATKNSFFELQQLVLHEHKKIVGFCRDSKSNQCVQKIICNYHEALAHTIQNKNKNNFFLLFSNPLLEKNKLFEVVFSLVLEFGDNDKFDHNLIAILEKDLEQSKLTIDGALKRKIEIFKSKK